MHFKLIHKGLVLVFVPVGFSLLILVCLTLLLQRADRQALQHSAAQNFISTVEDVQAYRMISKADMGMFILSRAPKYATRHKQSHQAVDAAFEHLLELCRNDGDKAIIVRRLRQRENQRYPIDRMIMSSANKLNLVAFLPTDDRDWTNYDQSGPQFDRLIADERPLEESTTTDLIKIWNQTQMTILFSLLSSLLIAILLALYFHRNISARLRNIKHNTIQIASNEGLLQPGGGQDEIAQLDLAVHETARQIKELELKKRTLTLAMAQRLQNPLQMIKATLRNLVQSGALTQMGVRNLGAADKSVDRLMRMVNDLLHLDELEEGRFQMIFREIRVDEVIKLSCDAVEMTASEKDVQIESQPSSLTVWADRDRLVQAIVNLLANAIKFSPEHSVVTLSAQESNGVVRIAIADRGRGMPEEFQKRLFTRFSQALASDAENQKGFGLGLAITKQIIDQHKGEISLTSKLKEGTTFFISLPRENHGGNSNTHTASSVKDGPAPAPFKKGSSLATRTSLRQKGLLLVGTPWLFQIFFALALSFLLWHAYARVNAAAHARAVASQCTQVLRNMDDMFLAAFSFALRGSENPASYEETKKRLHFSLLQLIAAADPEEMPAARKIVHTSNSISDSLDAIFRAKATGVADIISGAQKDNFYDVETMMDDVQDALTQLKNYQANFEARNPISRQAMRQQILSLLLIAFALNLGMALLLLRYLSTSITRRLLHVLENADRLLRREQLLSAVDGTDDIAEIDRTFYLTGERLLSLEKFKDELLCVVGHDLRTPICSLQGYLLMVKNGMVGTLPDALLEEVTVTEATAETLVDFINDLLTAERMKTNRGSL